MTDEVMNISSRISSIGSADSPGASIPPGSTLDTQQTITRTQSHAAPLPGHIYKIVSASCGRLIMVLNGSLVLASPDEFGAPFWSCEQHDTLLGFRNTATGKILGHDSGNPGFIRCEAQNLQQWEQLLAIPHTRTRDAFSLLAEYWYGQRAIGLDDEGEETRLCRIKDVHDPGNAWIFDEV